MLVNYSTLKRLLAHLPHFCQSQAGGGMVMMGAAFLALLMAASPFSSVYEAFIHAPVPLWFGLDAFSIPLSQLVSDGAMVLFFLLVGMELKREMLKGVLADKRQVLLPLCAALGGMAFPALLFMLINHNIPQNWQGWAIPSATDIAFALCIFALAGKLPPSLRIFLLAVAIFDDIGAIIIIALFYSGKLSVTALLMAAGAVVLLYTLNRLRVALLLPYIAAGAALCFFLHEGGIHTTIGGVITGMAIPLRSSKRCMHLLHPWVNFAILPLFAFTAAGINLHGVTFAALAQPLVAGIALGLFLGKQAGIFSISWLMIRCRLAHLPEGATWRQFYGVAVIAGIGFTMSLFIGMLAFKTPELQSLASIQVKLGVITGSMISALGGWMVLRYPSSQALPPS